MLFFDSKGGYMGDSSPVLYKLTHFYISVGKIFKNTLSRLFSYGLFFFSLLEG